jgi:hypothetical protein
MPGNLSQDWPVYALLAVVAFFYLYVIISGNKGGDKKDNQPEDKKTNK